MDPYDQKVVVELKAGDRYILKENSPGNIVDQNVIDDYDLEFDLKLKGGYDYVLVLYEPWANHIYLLATVNKNSKYRELYAYEPIKTKKGEFRDFKIELYVNLKVKKSDLPDRQTNTSILKMGNLISISSFFVNNGRIKRGPARRRSIKSIRSKSPPRRRISPKKVAVKSPRGLKESPKRVPMKNIRSKSPPRRKLSPKRVPVKKYPRGLKKSPKRVRSKSPPRRKLSPRGLKKAPKRVPVKKGVPPSAPTTRSVPVRKRSLKRLPPAKRTTPLLKRSPKRVLVKKTIPVRKLSPLIPTAQAVFAKSSSPKRYRPPLARSPKKISKITPHTTRSAVSTIPKKEKRQMIQQNAPLNEKQRKWCRCVLKVAAKQTPKCLQQKGWYKKYEGKECYNPYSICSKSVGTSSKECAKYYNLDQLTKTELLGYARLNSIQVNEKHTKKTIIDVIKTVISLNMTSM